MSTRRVMLSTALAGTVLSVLGDVARAQSTNPLGDPFAPWAAASGPAPADWRLAAMRWAVLAPNPHNRQPWLAELVGDDTVLVRCDLDRRLPQTDPFDRQIAIGLGAFCELFRMAAAERGIAVAMEPFPEGEPANDARLDARPVARLRRVSGTATPDPLFAHASTRRSAKRPFDMARPVAPETLARIAAAAGGAVGFATEAAPVAALRDLAWAAWLTEARTERTHLESVDLMRLGTAEIAARPDGIPVVFPGIDDMVAKGLISRAAFAAPGRPGYEQMVERYAPMLAATPAYVWTAGPAAGRAAQLAAGAQWLRLNLAATAAGVAVHPVSQALQEYPEMAPHFAALHAATGVGGAARLHMLGRIGFLPTADRAPATPRWAAESRILA